MPQHKNMLNYDRKYIAIRDCMLQNKIMAVRNAIS